MSKIKVKFATQVYFLSNYSTYILNNYAVINYLQILTMKCNFSVARWLGTQFYRNRNVKNLKNSKETEKFTLFLNNLFDTLNHKFPLEGIQKI